MKNKLLSIKVDDDMRQALEDVSKKEDRAMAWIIRKAIKEMLKNECDDNNRV